MTCIAAHHTTPHPTAHGRYDCGAPRPHARAHTDDCWCLPALPCHFPQPPSVTRWPELAVTLRGTPPSWSEPLTRPPPPRPPLHLLAQIKDLCDGDAAKYESVMAIVAVVRAVPKTSSSSLKTKVGVG
jgi:hypothetical protein